MSDLGTIAGATGLESAVNTIWAQTAALVALVPADRFLNGRIPPSQAMPYVRLESDGGQEHTRTNLNLYASHKLHFHIWTDGTTDFDLTIAAAIRNAFASIAFDWTSGGVTDMKWTGPPTSRQTTDPEIVAWQTTLSFSAETWEQRQDTPAITSSSGD